MKFEKKIIISWAAVILWMLLIFAFSAQPAVESEKVSMGVTAWIIRFFDHLAIIAGITPQWLDYMVRKSAHAAVFFVLAMLVVNAFLQAGVRAGRAFIFAFIVTFLYACSDELHQLAVPGRACMLSDIGIDSIGAICALGLFGAAYWLKIHKWNNFSEKMNSAGYKWNMFRSLRTNNE